MRILIAEDEEDIKSVYYMALVNRVQRLFLNQMPKNVSRYIVNSFKNIMNNNNIMIERFHPHHILM
jgi:hypothetical protein